MANQLLFESPNILTCSRHGKYIRFEVSIGARKFSKEMTCEWRTPLHACARLSQWVGPLVAEVGDIEVDGSVLKWCGLPEILTKEFFEVSDE